MAINYKAVRCFNRMYAPVAKRQLLGAQRLGMYDNKLSRTFLAQITEGTERRIARIVAFRFGITLETLMREIWEADTLYHDYYLRHKLDKMVGFQEADNSWHWNLEEYASKAHKLR